MTNPASWHLALNHVAVLGTLFGFMLLAWASLRQSRELILVSFVFMFASAVVSVPVYLTGEPAEDIIKHQPGVSRRVMHEHEEAAESAFIGMIALGVVAASALATARVFPRFFKACQYTSLLAGALMAAWMLWTAHLGGLIQHSEIDAGAATLATKSGEAD
jgi:hypothetical protein